MMLVFVVRPSGKRVVNSRSFVMVTTAAGTSALIALAYSSVNARGDSLSAAAVPHSPAITTNTAIRYFTAPLPSTLYLQILHHYLEQIKNTLTRCAQRKIAGTSPGDLKRQRDKVARSVV